MPAPISSLAAFGDRDVGEIAARHIEAAFLELLGPLGSEGVEIHEGWLRAVTGAAHPFGNLVLVLTPDEPEELDEAVGPLLDLEAPSMVLYPHAAVSEDVHERLGSMGFEQHDPMPAMAVDIPALTPTSLPEGCEMLRIEGAEASADWVEALAEGYELPREVAELFTPEPHARNPALSFHAAVRDGRIVGTTTLLLARGVAGIYCVSTVPDERGRGIGAHLTAEPLRQAARAGHGVGVLQSSPQGHSIYRALGFEDVGEVQLYVRAPG